MKNTEMELVIIILILLRFNLIFTFSYENAENNVVEAAQACRPQYCHSYKLLYCDNKLHTIVLQDLLVSKMINLGGVKPMYCQEYDRHFSLLMVLLLSKEIVKSFY